MARFTRLAVLNEMNRAGLVPVFYHEDLEVAKQAVAAAAKGGSNIFEFTNRGDRAWEIFTRLEAFCAAEIPQMMLGVGSVVDAGTASLYINCGAAFVVGPVLNEDVARACNRRKIAYSPGCGSASEISKAEELGCEIVKVFPGSQVGGPGFIKSVCAPCPWSALMPTGGVDATRESLTEWFEAGAVCVGIGSKLVTKDLVAQGDWDGFAARVSETLAIIRELKQGS